MIKLVISFVIVAYPIMAQAGNYSLTGKLKDGTIVGWDSDPPSYVSVTKHSNTKAEEIKIFERVECDLTFGNSENFEVSRKTSYFTCTSSNKSPLAGARYKFKRHVGDNCVKQDDYDIYTCVSGCNKHAPKELIKGGYCGPC
jgi:hypothetical protein